MPLVAANAALDARHHHGELPLSGDAPDRQIGQIYECAIKMVEWEHIHQTRVETDVSIFEAARRLGMHRRTLARKLEKRQSR